ncbi:Dimodular nonribosomal peptide synthase [Marinomonas spartinae]|uniref:Dimodular nonribosomal peptide synthase n=1 Tax=Marinomonas spartinae TaxID=1792290 RepID=A0A1A8TDU9_9GAMM|nr:non-ribosomal peptide synthetase [Marinomonas spartinae]SBS30210.1 Dimodular nonribosomal peptide synthase [Marinomonas spartinae]
MIELTQHQAELKKAALCLQHKLPLSTAQRGQWIAQKLNDENAAFNIAEYLDIIGNLNPNSFSLAIKQLIREADCIRSRIIEEDDQTLQIILDDDRGYHSLLDFSISANPHAAAISWMHKDMQQPLNQSHEPLWCSALIKVGEEHHYWYHRCHHVALDGYAGNLLTQRLSEIYNAIETSQDTGPNPFGSLVDLINIETEYKHSSRFKKDRKYWLENLVHIPDAVSLSKRIAPSNKSLLRKAIQLPQALKDELSIMSKHLQASLPQALIALVAAYFYRMTGAEDLVFAMPVTARTSRLHRSTPGMMANAVPIRLNIDTNTNFESLIKQVSKVVLKALRHQQYRYEDLKRDLGLMSNGQQIASLGVNIEPFDYNLTFGNCSTSLHNLSNAVIDDLTVFIFDRHDNSGLKIEFDVNPNRYTEQDLTNHSEQFKRMVKDLVMDPSQPISKASLLSDGERNKILKHWNDTSKPIPKLSVVDLFDAQVMRTPSAIAVTDKQESLTYFELNCRANAWARRLQQETVGTHDLVAIALTRNTDMLVALLATLKTGAAYLPLDPDFPEERLLQILEDAQPKIVLSCQAAVNKLPNTNTQTLFLDKPDFNIHQAEAHQHLDNIAITGDSPAYVIYTSGSTGRPKGVEIPHKALINFLYAMQNVLALTPKDRFLAVTTISFDISILELFLPITVGASVLIAERSCVRDPELLTRFAVDHNATLMQATPSLWQAILPTYSEQWYGIRPLVGGEALQGQLANHMAKLGHPVLNLFGPTETTIWSTIMFLDNPTDLNHPPIGRPIFNTQVYVLDKAMEPVPVDVTGDLYIAGEGLALGYYKRPDLTQERFTPNPFESGTRLYATGDKARWRQDGVLEYLGREDNQVKIRGFRIETGDIETSLLSCREVQQAVVVAQASNTDEMQLVAYIIPVDETLDSQTIRSQLIASLPDYMVPNYYVMLKEMPLTPNGKINRKALPKPNWTDSSHYVAPRNKTEAALATLWEDVLGVRRVGIHDNFFAIGGDSISATKMINLVKKQLLIEIPLGVLFKTSTISDLAEMLDSDHHHDPLAHVLPLKTDGDEAPLFCIHPALGLSLSYTNLLRYLPKSTPLYALQADGLNHTSRLPMSVEEMAEDYIIRIKRIQPKGPYRLLGWSFGGLVSHAIAEKLQALGEDISFLCMLDSYPYQLSVAKPKDEAGMIQSSLLFLGYDLDNIPSPPKNKAELAAFLWQEFDDSSLAVVAEIQKQHSNILDHIERVITNNLTIASHFTPRQVDANLLFFVAEGSMNGSMGEILEHQAQAWRSRVTGKLDIHDIKCRHQEILDPHYMDQIGPIIKAHLIESNTNT